jgi:hypothetical protein
LGSGRGYSLVWKAVDNEKSFGTFHHACLLDIYFYSLTRFRIDQFEVSELALTPELKDLVLGISVALALPVLAILPSRCGRSGAGIIRAFLHALSDTFPASDGDRPDDLRASEIAAQAFLHFCSMLAC